jgi:hypothetical protein
MISQSNNLNSSLRNEHFLKYVIEALETTLNPSSMLIRTNIVFLGDNIHFAMDPETFTNLCQVYDSLITAVEDLNKPDSELHIKLLYVQALLFNYATIRVAGSLPQSESSFMFRNFGIVVNKMAIKPLVVNFKLDRPGNESVMDISIPKELTRGDTAVIATYTLKTISSQQLLEQYSNNIFSAKFATGQTQVFGVAFKTKYVFHDEF